MTEKRSQTQAFGFVVVLVAVLVVWAAWTAIQKPVQLTDSGPAVEAHWPDMRINVNTADVAEFTVLPGIGHALAERIVEDRNVNGQFNTIDELDRVKGVGSVTIGRIKDLVVVE